LRVRAEELRRMGETTRMPAFERSRSFRPSVVLVNGLSISRLLVSGPIVMALLSDSPSGDRLAVTLMLWALFSDIADGRIARRTGSKSRLGAILDPVADKILIGCIVTVLVLVRSLPVWAAGIIILRDLSILALGGWLVRDRGIVLESNNVGKVTGVAFASMIALYTLRFEKAGFALAILSVALVVFSSFSYTVRLMQVLKGR
jgi:CDP-diacylglycerol--glycerol-3-phosphate 3-phosphatidyltransferase